MLATAAVQLLCLLLLALLKACSCGSSCPLCCCRFGVKVNVAADGLLPGED